MIRYILQITVAFIRTAALLLTGLIAMLVIFGLPVLTIGAICIYIITPLSDQYQWSAGATIFAFAVTPAILLLLWWLLSCMVTTLYDRRRYGYWDWDWRL
jgi:hypothetical protein